MEVVKGISSPIYLEETSSGYFRTKNPSNSPKGQILYSLVQKELTEGIANDEFYFISRTISSSDIEAFRAEVISLPMTRITETSGELWIDGKLVSFLFIPTETIYETGNISTVISQINRTVVAQLGSGYSGFANTYPTINDETSPTRIILKSPNKENSSIIVPENSIWTREFGIKAGEYNGDLPFEYRSYTENSESETFILVQETTTPNNGKRSDKFIKTIEKNGIIQYLSQFDQNLINDNQRLKILLDGFAFMASRLSEEMDRFLDQINLSKIDPNNLEYLAYLFGLDLKKYLKDINNNTLNAREILKNIMAIIQRKGTVESFALILKFLGFIPKVIESRPPESSEDVIGEEVNLDIRPEDLQLFYDRYIISSSEFRNPIVTYGSSVSDFSQLPSNPYLGEKIKVKNDINISGVLYISGIYEWQGSLDEFNGNPVWVRIFDNTSPILGQENAPSDFIQSLKFTFESIDQPFFKITAAEYNNSNLIKGFDVVGGNGIWFGNGIYNISDEGNVTTNAAIRGFRTEPFDMTLLENRTLKLKFDKTYVLDFDITDYLSEVSDLEYVTIDEIKNIIEPNFPNIAVTATESGKIAFISKKYGTESYIEVLDGNFSLGINGPINLLGEPADFSRGFVRSDTIKITNFKGTYSEAVFTDGAEYPEVQLEETILSIKNINNPSLDPPDGIYNLYVHKDGYYIVVSDNPFWIGDDIGTAIFVEDFGWVSRLFDLNDVLLIATLEVINGQFTWINERVTKDDYRPNTNLSFDQEKTIRAFIRFKLNTAGDERISSNLDDTEGFIGDIYSPEGRNDIPFYDRNGFENTLISPLAGLSNRLILDATPINPESFSITQDFIITLSNLLKYIRPVHIEILNLLLNIPEFRDDWPTIEEADQLPGGTHRVWSTTATVPLVYQTLTLSNVINFNDGNVLTQTRIDGKIAKGIQVGPPVGNIILVQWTDNIEFEISSTITSSDSGVATVSSTPVTHDFVYSGQPIITNSLNFLQLNIFESLNIIPMIGAGLEGESLGDFWDGDYNIEYSAYSNTIIQPGFYKIFVDINDIEISGINPGEEETQWLAGSYKPKANSFLADGGPVGTILDINLFSNSSPANDYMIVQVDIAFDTGAISGIGGLGFYDFLDNEREFVFLGPPFYLSITSLGEFATNNNEYTASDKFYKPSYIRLFQSLKFTSPNIVVVEGYSPLNYIDIQGSLSDGDYKVLNRTYRYPIQFTHTGTTLPSSFDILNPGSETIYEGETINVVGGNAEGIYTVATTTSGTTISVVEIIPSTDLATYIGVGPVTEFELDTSSITSEETNTATIRSIGNKPITLSENIYFYNDSFRSDSGIIYSGTDNASLEGTTFKFMHSIYEFDNNASVLPGNTAITIGGTPEDTLVNLYNQMVLDYSDSVYIKKSSSNNIINYSAKVSNTNKVKYVYDSLVEQSSWGYWPLENNSFNSIGNEATHPMLLSGGAYYLGINNINTNKQVLGIIRFTGYPSSVRFLGGTYPSGHELEGQQIPTLPINFYEPFSFEFWYKRNGDSSVSVNFFFNDEKNSENNYRLVLLNDKVLLQYYGFYKSAGNGAEDGEFISIQSPGGTIITNQNYHIVYTYNPKNYTKKHKVYVNGIEVLSDDNFISNSGPYTDMRSMYISQNSQTAVECQFDDFAIYKKELSQLEVESHFNAINVKRISSIEFKNNTASDWVFYGGSPTEINYKEKERDRYIVLELENFLGGTIGDFNNGDTITQAATLYNPSGASGTQIGEPFGDIITILLDSNSRYFDSNSVINGGVTASIKHYMVENPVSLTLDSATNFDDGDIITQISTGASGRQIGPDISDTIIVLLDVDSPDFELGAISTDSGATLATVLNIVENTPILPNENNYDALKPPQVTDILRTLPLVHPEENATVAFVETNFEEIITNYQSGSFVTISVDNENFDIGDRIVGISGSYSSTLPFGEATRTSSLTGGKYLYVKEINPTFGILAGIIGNEIKNTAKLALSAISNNPIEIGDVVTQTANSSTGVVANILDESTSNTFQTICFIATGSEILISGDATSSFSNGDRVNVINTEFNDGSHLINAVPTYDAVLDETTIVVTSVLTDEHKSTDILKLDAIEIYTTSGFFDMDIATGLTIGAATANMDSINDTVSGITFESISGDVVSSPNLSLGYKPGKDLTDPWDEINFPFGSTNTIDYTGKNVNINYKDYLNSYNKNTLFRTKGYHNSFNNSSDPDEIKKGSTYFKGVSNYDSGQDIYRNHGAIDDQIFQIQVIVNGANPIPEVPILLIDGKELETNKSVIEYDKNTGKYVKSTIITDAISAVENLRLLIY